MQDLFEELYGSRRHGRYSDDWTEPDFHDREPTGPDKHGYRYYVFFGCTCEVCHAACDRERDKARIEREMATRPGAKPKPWVKKAEAAA